MNLKRKTSGSSSPPSEMSHHRSSSQSGSRVSTSHSQLSYQDQAYQLTTSRPNDASNLPALDTSAAGLQPQHPQAGQAYSQQEDTPTSENKAHLSEQQKKANHIASEKKRRHNIREQYDRLADMVPGMSGQGRSEGRVLEEVAKLGRELTKERQRLVKEIERRGGKVDDELRDLGGSVTSVTDLGVPNGAGGKHNGSSTRQSTDVGDDDGRDQNIPL